MPEAIAVLIVEDHRAVADALAALLSAEPDLRVTGIASGVADAARLAAEVAPEVVLVDWGLPDGTGADAARRIRAASEDAAMVFLSADDSEETILAALETGAAGYLSKAVPGPQVIAAVRAAAAGEMVISRERVAALLTHARLLEKAEVKRARLLDELTAREQEVLRLMVHGLDNRGVAAELHISYETVRTHVKRILDKLGARTRLEAVVQAIERGLVAGPA